MDILEECLVLIVAIQKIFGHHVFQPEIGCFSEHQKSQVGKHFLGGAAIRNRLIQIINKFMPFTNLLLGLNNSLVVASGFPGTMVVSGYSGAHRIPLWLYLL